MQVRRVPGAAWLVRHGAEILLALTVSGLAAGLGLYLAGAHDAADTAWTVVGAGGAGYALWAMGEALAHRRLGVDVIALLAIIGAYQIRRLGQLIDDIGPGQPDEADVADLRALLYGLHATLRLHTTQEEENYLSLGDDAQKLPSEGSGMAR